MYVPIRWGRPESLPVKLPDAILTARMGLTVALESAIKSQKIDPANLYKAMVTDFDEEWYLIARAPYIEADLEIRPPKVSELPVKFKTGTYGDIPVITIIGVIRNKQQKGKRLRGRWRYLVMLESEMDAVLKQEFNAVLDKEARAAIFKSELSSQE